MYFPHPFHPDETIRAGRMMMAGRVKVTVTSPTTNQHITILLKCIADNRNRQYKENVDKNWIECPYPDATHVFAEVPNASGEWNDKVGTYYPRTGKWYDADHADKSRVWAAQAVGHWLEHPGTPPAGAIYQEASECGVCGRELTDPVSIERGIGPVCLGALTGSEHQVKDAEVHVLPKKDHVDLFDWSEFTLDQLKRFKEDVEQEINIRTHTEQAQLGLDGDTTFMGR